MTILVTGSTGHLGRLIVAALLQRGVDPQAIRGGARDLAKGADLGVPVVRLDYTDQESVAAALDGVDTGVLVSGSEVGQRVAQHRAVIDAAKAASVSKLVYTSAPKATTSTLVLAPEHKATEELIAAAGIPAVILRNNWYTENYAADLARAAETGTLSAGTGDGRVASASRKDYAEAAAVVAIEDGHLGAVYELGGDVAWSYAELAAAMAEVTGRSPRTSSSPRSAPPGSMRAPPASSSPSTPASATAHWRTPTARSAASSAARRHRSSKASARWREVRSAAGRRHGRRRPPGPGSPALCT